MTAQTTTLTCPACGLPGQSVRRITLESLLRDERKGEIGEDDYRVCATPGCSTVYFNQAGRVFQETDLRVPFGLKGNTKPMTVCYCFAYAAEDIHLEIARTGQTTVLDSIKMRMKEEGCHCEDANPLGACCLDTVRAVIAKANSSQSSGQGAALCNPSDGWAASESAVLTAKSVASSGTRAGMWAAGGSVVSAALSSACCWLPLLLIAFGASAAGVAGFFERWRTAFIGTAVVLLACGFYFTYRKPADGGDDCCDGSTGRLARFSRGMLWVAAVAVGAMVFFPNYVGALLSDGNTPAQADLEATAGRRMVFQIEGMTCQGCATILHEALIQVPGVSAAKVDYEGSAATVWSEKTGRLTDATVIEAVKTAGYSAKPAE